VRSIQARGYSAGPERGRTNLTDLTDLTDHVPEEAPGRLCDQCGASATPADPLNPWRWRGRPGGNLAAPDDSGAMARNPAIRQ
jgi:hypothetical protein